MSEKLPPMTVKHAHVELAEAQRIQKTLLCPGPCPHPFYGLEANYAVYGLVTKGETFEYYDGLLEYTNLPSKYRRVKAELLAAAEIYTKKMIQIWVEICGLRTFKDQDGVYQRWGPPGDFMMMRVGDYVRKLEEKLGIRIVNQHDCKRGDLGATMMGYYDRFIGDLFQTFEIPHSYLKYDTMNIHVHMGKDTAMLEEVNTKKNYVPARGLELMREKGKCIIAVDKTSNDSGPDYQQLFIRARGKMLEECIAEDVNSWVEHYGLIYDGLSTMGLVDGSTHKSYGMIRMLFPTATLWVPGFGNQGGKFENIMLELIRDPGSKWNGQGAIFTNETAAMYAHLEKFGGSGSNADREKYALKLVKRHRKEEYLAYQTPEVIEAGIRYPFDDSDLDLAA